MSRFAVLTGDIVDSSNLTASELDACMKNLHAAAIEISGWDKDITTGFARRGGDGWQIVMQRPRLAFRAALYLQATLRQRGKDHATRLAIAVQQGRLPIAYRRNPNSGHGPAFTESGRLLDSITGQATMAHADGGARAAAIRLADHIAKGWTVAQARAMAHALPPDAPPRADIAVRLGVTRQAVNQALWGAGFPALSDALGYLEGKST